MEYYQHRDYLKMIITGLIYNRDYLAQYLIREQKKAEKDHIEFSEFIGRTITVVEDLEMQFRRINNQKKLDLEVKKDGENDNLIDKQIKNLRVFKDFKLPMELSTDGEFKVSLGFWDIDEVRIAINDAFNFYSIEKEGEENYGPIEYFQREIDDINGIVFNTKTEIDLNEKYTHTIWFKIGLTFATGQAQELYEKYKEERGHFTKIATQLGFKETDRPYISETINNSTVDNKNIYSSPEKLRKIYNFCQVKNIEVCPDFKAQLPSK